MILNRIYRNKCKIIGILLLAALILSAVAFALGESEAEIQLILLGYWHDDMDEESAIYNFQVANGLFPTAKLDEETQECLLGDTAISETDFLRNYYRKYADVELALGTVGGGVSGLQDALQTCGYLTGATDNAFGEETQKAVAWFQLANGLPPTGIADADTLLRLYEGKPVTWDAFVAKQCALAGDSGAQVKHLQNRLIEMGYFEGLATGSYGDVTIQAVARFQSANGLPVTGNADSATVVLLYSDTAVRAYAQDTLWLGSTGDGVRAVQYRLKALGYEVSDADGEYGIVTRNMVLLFQIANNLPRTGAVDAETQRTLNADDAVKFDALEDMQYLMSAENRAGIAFEARKLLGHSFDSDGDGIFHGFEMIQYVCALEGMAILRPQDVVQNAIQFDSAPEKIPQGMMVVMEQSGEDGMTVRMGVCVGDGYMAYPDSETGLVLVSRLADMAHDKLYVQ